MAKKISCKQAQSCIQPYMERRLSPAAEESYLDHLETCRDCYDDLEINYIVNLGLELLDHENREAESDLTGALRRDIAARRFFLQVRKRVAHVRTISCGTVTAGTLYIAGEYWLHFPTFVSLMRNLFHFLQQLTASFF